MTEERRLVTILFADVAGSTALGEELDPEDLRALLTRYYAIAREVIADYGGTVEKFIGDAVMAVFGLPVAHGDDAERAIGAALDLRDKVREDPRLKERLPLRLGVASGEVVARRDAAAGEDFLITGDAVNTAARLQQQADPWGILVAERSSKSARGFVYGPPARLEAKGKAQPIPARALVGRTTRSRRQLPMIGRDADLMQLELVARRVFTEHRPFLVSIVAPAGTGKTRLVEALLERLPEISHGGTVAIAQCLPYGQRLTYWPLRSVLSRLVGTDDDTSPDEARRMTAAWLQDRGVEDAPGVADALLATVGTIDLEALDRATLFNAWRTAIEAAATDGPLTIVLEDLHWSSDSLLDLLDSLVQPRPDLPILIVAIARPELLDRRASWSGGRRNSLSLSLEPLPDVDVATLVAHLVEGIAPDVVEAVVERADGNPFYAGEIVRAIVEQVGPKLDANAVEAALQRLPDTVQATVLARLDLLSATERRILQVGSIFGRGFALAGVIALDPSVTNGAEDTLEELLERDLVRQAGPHEVTFRHILIREVAYGMLPRAERARLHHAAADWLATRSGGQTEAFAELIAVHAREAASLATALDLDDAAEFRREAVGRLEAAASAAEAAAANVEALRHLRAALEFATPDRHLDLYERIGNTFVHGDTSIDAMTIALRLARSTGAPSDRVLGILNTILTFHTRWQGSVAGRPSEPELRALFDEGRALLPNVTDELTVGRFRAAEAFMPFWTSVAGRPPTGAEIEAADASARQALDVGSRLDVPDLQSAALDALGSNAQQRGDYAEMRRTALRRLDLGERLDLSERIDAACMVAWAATTVGDLAEAAATCESAFRLIQPGQVSNWALHLAAWSALTAELQGNWDQVERSGARAHALWQQLDRVAAGYASRGFLAAYEVARARRDDVGITRWREALTEIDDAFHDSIRADMERAVIDGDAPAAARLLVSERLPAVGYDTAERVLSFISDRGATLPDSGLEMLGAWIHPTARLMGAQLDRARGLAQRDEAALRAVLAFFEGAGARPAMARVRVELGRLTGDTAMVDAGMRGLLEIADTEQHDRYSSARTG
jgi:class 3 adenylate cyclase/tetratricopeptide (TPR) repeat protein